MWHGQFGYLEIGRANDMELFNIISVRDFKTAGQVRPDLSMSDLEKWDREGYTQVVFVKNPTADEECTQYDGNLYNISELMDYDQPLFRTSHINCQCSFVPYGEALSGETANEGFEEAQEGIG